jgi:hypothetical protein
MLICLKENAMIGGVRFPYCKNSRKPKMVFWMKPESDQEKVILQLAQSSTSNKFCLTITNKRGQIAEAVLTEM